MPLEPTVLGRDDRLPQHWRHVVIADDDAPLDGEFADLLTVLREKPGDGVRAVIVECADLRQIAAVGEEHATERSKRRGDKKQEDEHSLKADLQHQPGALSAWFLFSGRHLSLSIRAWESAEMTEGTDAQEDRSNGDERRGRSIGRRRRPAVT
jgi:hypothetical protein